MMPFDWKLIVPYIVSNLVGIAMVIAAYRAPRLGRVLIVVGFLVAAAANATIALTDPHAYLAFGQAAVPPYPWLIAHVFAHAQAAFVLLIAAMQAAGALLLAFGGRTGARLGALVLIVFLVAIAPFGIGSAFPASLVMALAVWKVRTQL